MYVLAWEESCNRFDIFPDCFFIHKAVSASVTLDDGMVLCNMIFNKRYLLYLSKKPLSLPCAITIDINAFDLIKNGRFLF